MTDITGKLKDFFRDRDDVLLAFLFGSAAAGRETDESDIDIAVLAGEGFDAGSFLELKSALSDMLSGDIDLVILNDASPILKMQVIQKGILLKAADETAYPCFFAKGLKEYEDLKYFRAEAEKRLLSGQAHG